MTSWFWIRISQHFISNEHKWNIYKYLVIYVAQVWNDSADGNVSQHDVTREVHPVTQLELHQLTRRHPRHHQHLPSSVTAGVVVVFILLKVYAVVLGFFETKCLHGHSLGNLIKMNFCHSRNYGKVCLWDVLMLRSFNFTVTHADLVRNTQMWLVGEINLQQYDLFSILPPQIFHVHQ